MMIANIILAAISLAGVTGEKLRVRAFFDVNNAKVGDPLVLTVDFIGTADFKSLHPPALSRFVDSNDWILYDESAKTQTESQRVGGFFSSHEVAVARRLTYRVRPKRDGVLWFPALEFEYATASGEKRVVRSNEIPVHARRCADVVVKEMGEDDTALPQPGELLSDAGVELSADEGFAWRRALSKPTADAFAAFDFPAARLNEAICAIRAGDWKRALDIYGKLDWQIGQTPEIERGMVAALALRYGNPAAKLPIWRQIARPVLKRYGWKGRFAIVGGGVAAAVALFLLLGRIVRALACVALAALLALPAEANSKRPAQQRSVDPFAAMEQMMQRHRQQMQQMMSGAFGGGGFSMSINGEDMKPPTVKASLAMSNPSPKVGERFDFIVSLEVPRGTTIEPNSVTPSVPCERCGLDFVTRGGERMTDGKASSTNFVVRRIAIPARFDVPFSGSLSFTVGGMVSGQSSGRRGFFSSFHTSFETHTQELQIRVKPLDNQPKDFSGIVAARLSMSERADGLKVGTNDVIRITYRIDADGWLPEDWLPPGAAFECGRSKGRNGGVSAEWQAYFVADGAAATPRVKVVYYVPAEKSFRTVTTGGSRITYRSEESTATGQ